MKPPAVLTNADNKYGSKAELELGGWLQLALTGIAGMFTCA